MILSGLIGSAIVQSIIGFVSPIFKVIGAIVSSTVETLRNIKIKTDGLVVGCLILACAFGGWVITSSAREAGRQMERASLEQSQRKVKEQLALYVRVKRGEISEDKVRLDLLGQDIKNIIDRLPKDTIVEKVEIPGETVHIQVPMVFGPIGGKAPTKPVAAPKGPFQPDYPSDLHDAINKINLRQK